MPIVCDFDEYPMENYNAIWQSSTVPTITQESASGYTGKGARIAQTQFTCISFPQFAFSADGTYTVSALVLTDRVNASTAGNFNLGGVAIVKSATTGAVITSASVGAFALFDSRNSVTTSASMAYQLRYPNVGSGNIVVTAPRANAGIVAINIWYRVEMDFVLSEGGTKRDITIRYYKHETNTLVATLNYSTTSDAVEWCPAVVFYNYIHLDCLQFQANGQPYMSNLRSKVWVDGAWKRAPIKAPAHPGAKTKLYDPTSGTWKW